MKKTVYLHIGTFKTGTSAIQNFLARNAETLQRHDFFVPAFDEREDHYVLPLSLLLAHTKIRAVWPPVKKTPDEYWASLKRQMMESTCSQIIISAETFCDLAHPRAIAQRSLFARVLTDTFLDFNVKIVVYLRNMKNYIHSMHSENVKNGGMKVNIATYMTSAIEANSIHINPLLFLDFFSDLFGKDSLILKKYEKSNLRNGNIIDDFLSTIHCPLEAMPNLSTDLIVNKSLPSSLSVDLKRIFNECDFIDLYFNRLMSDRLLHAVEQSKGISLAESQLAVLRENARIVAERYGVEIGEHLEEIGRQQESVDERTTFFVLLLSQILKETRMLRGELNDIKTKLDALEKQNERLSN
jgi:hypothetical protein